MHTMHTNAHNAHLKKRARARGRVTEYCVTVLLICQRNRHHAGRRNPVLT